MTNASSTQTPAGGNTDADTMPHLIHLMMLASRAGYTHFTAPAANGMTTMFVSELDAYVMTFSQGMYTVFYRSAKADNEPLLGSNSLEAAIRALAVRFGGSLRSSYDYEPFMDFSAEIPSSTPLVRPAGGQQGALISIPNEPDLRLFVNNNFWDWPSIAHLIKSFEWPITDMLKAQADPYGRPLSNFLDTRPKALPLDMGLTPFNPAETGALFRLLADSVQSAGGTVDSRMNGTLVKFTWPDQEIAISLFTYAARYYLWIDRKDAMPASNPFVLLSTPLEEVVLRSLALLMGPHIRQHKGYRPLYVPTEVEEKFYSIQAITQYEDIMATPEGQTADVIMSSAQDDSPHPQFMTIAQMINVSYYSPASVIDAFLQPDGGSLAHWVAQ